MPVTFRQTRLTRAVPSCAAAARASLGGGRRAVRLLLTAATAGLLAVAPRAMAAQVVASPAASLVDTGSMVGAIRTFLDCRGDTDLGCRLDYFVTELPYVTWTRDRLFADVQFLVTTIRTGSGAFEYTVTALGRGRFAGRADTTAVRTIPNEAEASIRAKLARTIALLLVPYVRTTPQAEQLAVKWTPPAGGARTLSPGAVRDPWNFWTFEVEVNGNTNGESQQRSSAAFLEARARRVTERWSARVGYFGFYRGQFFRFTDSTGARVTVRNQLREGIAFGRVVRALTPRWSVGMLANTGFDEFRNINLVARAAPVVEYNVFPWSQATRQQVAISYGIGPRRFLFEDSTIFGRLRETRLQQELVIGSDVRQTWGSIRISARYASFVPDTRLWNLGSFGNATLNLFKGLSLNVGGGASYIRDQNFLAARGQTPEEVLTRQRALATNFQYNAFLGFNYTFGSIYNSVVNPRLDFFNLGGN
jgi:hypothetical protein